MNTPKEIYSRLLKLFPVQSLKDFYTISGSQIDLVQHVSSRNTIDNMNTFLNSHLTLTKQHIFVYSHSNRNYSRVNSNVFSDCATVIGESNSVNKKTFSLLFDVEFQLSVTGQIEEVSIKYKWPVRVTITPTNVIIHVTIFERNPAASEFPDNRKVFVIERSITEDEIVSKIMESLNRFSALESCDINNGVKHLWAIDVIDARFAEYKKANSISSETMDAAFTIKAHERALYEQIILTPLREIVFEFMGTHKNENIRYITIDPSLGKINVSIYPDDVNQIDNIIERILQNN